MTDLASVTLQPVWAGSVLDRDPDLGEDLQPAQFAMARRHAIARFLRYQRGPWVPAATDYDAVGSLGLLVVEGILVRKVTVGERSCAELLGPGDVTQPWLKVGPEGSVGTDVSWEVAEPLRLAVLDVAFASRISRWPEILAAIARRIMLRVYWLSFHLAVCHMRRVDDRLVLVLWHFADRWGRVTPRGIEIPLPLPHRLLALVVGAHRPTVTAALRQLAAAERVQPRPRSRWLLCGEPPEEFREMREYAARYEGTAPLAIQWARSGDGLIGERLIDADAPPRAQTPTSPPQQLDPGTQTPTPVTVDGGTSTLDVRGSGSGPGARAGHRRQ